MIILLLMLDPVANRIQSYFPANPMPMDVDVREKLRTE